MDALLKEKKLVCSNDYVFESIQGEGRYVGVPAVFLRLSGCNLRCRWRNTDGSETLCDSSYASHEAEKNVKSLFEIVSDISKYPKTHQIIITGGEPFLQPEIGHLIHELAFRQKRYVTIETNGTIFIPTSAQFISISPKLSNSEMLSDKGRLIESVSNLMRRHFHQLKFVVNQQSDIAEIKNFLNSLRGLGHHFGADNVYLMPQGNSAEQFNEKLPWIVQEAIRNNWSVTDRLHIRIYGSKRGV